MRRPMAGAFAFSERVHFNESLRDSKTSLFHLPLTVLMIIIEDDISSQRKGYNEIHKLEGGYEMKKVRLANNVKLLGIKNFKGKEKLVDYYIIFPNEQIYAFSKRYTHQSYRICKSGIIVNDLMATKSRDTGIMTLVKYTNLMMPYLKEYYDLPCA